MSYTPRLIPLFFLLISLFRDGSKNLPWQPNTKKKKKKKEEEEEEEEDKS